MKKKSFLSTVAQVFADDPSLMICYDVKTAYFAKSKDEEPTARTAFVGNTRIGLKRLVAGSVLLASTALMLCVSGALGKKKK